MFLAFTDYINYRRRRGRYSHAQLTKKGLSLATRENFRDFHKFTLGHILFASTSNSILSWLVMYCTNSPLSHTAIFYGDGIINDCTTSGIVRHSFANYLDGKSYLMVVPPLPGFDVVAAKEFMDQTLGAPYGWRKVFWVFLYILVGSHANFSWRIAIDFTVLLTIFWLVLHSFFHTSVYFFAVLITGYIGIVTANQVIMKTSQSST